MPEFTCVKCGSKVVYGKNDTFFEKRGWRCLAGCLTTISDKDYPPGEVTVFTHIGNALGDNTVFEVVKRNYLKDNPNETVIFLMPEDNQRKIIEMIKPDKIFISEFYTEDTECLQSLPQSTYINILNDVCAYAERGDFPRLEYEPVRPPVYIPEKFVALHIRNINKSGNPGEEKRNVDQGFLSKVIKVCEEADLPIVILGNDRVNDVWGIYDQIYDYRNQLSLAEISCILKKSFVYLGRDSGLMHVAAACDCNIVSWNHAGSKWFPKCRNFKSFIRGAKEEKILEAIRNEILGCT